MNTPPSWDGFPLAASRPPAVREQWTRERGGSQRGEVSKRGGLPQIRVSWCHRLDGRMLSTFSMTKFKGANKVLRNCNETRETQQLGATRFGTARCSSMTHA